MTRRSPKRRPPRLGSHSSRPGRRTCSPSSAATDSAPWYNKRGLDPEGTKAGNQAWILRNVNHCVEVTQFTCNGTGAGDGHANHWVRLVSPVNFTGGKATFTVFTWARR